MPDEGVTFFASAVHFIIVISILGVITLFLGMLVPRKMNYRAFPLRPFGFERNGRLYLLLRVHRWKNGLPDASKAIKMMTRKTISQTMDAAALERLIQETCIAEFSHWVLIALTFAYSMLASIRYGMLFSLIYTLANLPFIIVQRYNRPRLVHMLEAMEARGKRGRERRNEINENNHSRKGR